MALPPFELEEYLMPREFTARHYFCGSDLESRPMKEVLAMADEEAATLWDNLSLAYPETSGHPVLRDEIAKLYRDANRDNVLCFAGAEEGIYAAAHCVLEKGDHTIAVTPCYQSHVTVPASIGEVTKVALVGSPGTELEFAL